MSEHVHVALDAGVLSVTLARPDKKNAITQAMYAVLAEATERAKTDPDVRVILFRAEGDSFCAGNDIADFIAIGSGTGQPTDMAVFRFLKALAELDISAPSSCSRWANRSLDVGRWIGVWLTGRFRPVRLMTRRCVWRSCWRPGRRIPSVPPSA